MLTSKSDWLRRFSFRTLSFTRGWFVHITVSGDKIKAKISIFWPIYFIFMLLIFRWIEKDNWWGLTLSCLLIHVCVNYCCSLRLTRRPFQSDHFPHKSEQICVSSATWTTWAWSTFTCDRACFLYDRGRDSHLYDLSIFCLKAETIRSQFTVKSSSIEVFDFWAVLFFSLQCLLVLYVRCSCFV